MLPTALLKFQRYTLWFAAGIYPCIIPVARDKSWIKAKKNAPPSGGAFSYILKCFILYIAALQASISFLALALVASSAVAFSKTSIAAENSFLALATSAA